MLFSYEFLAFVRRWWCSGNAIWSFKYTHWHKNWKKISNSIFQTVCCNLWATKHWGEWNVFHGLILHHPVSCCVWTHRWGCQTLTLLLVFHSLSSGFLRVQCENIQSLSPSSQPPSLRPRLAAVHLHPCSFCEKTNGSRIMHARLFAGQTSPVTPACVCADGYWV